jgi:predicted DCC family thiol-disulfide oxidoreductase YuxK
MRDVTVWFDGSCPLCSREIALMRRLDRRGNVAFVDVADGAAGCPIDHRALLERFHAREGSDPIVSGAAAFAVMWRAIPLLRPLGLLARSPIVLRVLERLYLAFLKRRPTSPALRIAFGNASMTPTPVDSTGRRRPGPVPPANPT